MTAVLGDTSPYPVHTLNRELYLWCASIPITASTGVVGTVDATDAAITCSRASAGTYSLAYPQCPKIRFVFQFEDTGTQTVFLASVTAKSATAGTATFKTLNASMAAADTGASSALTVTVMAFGEAR